MSTDLPRQLRMLAHAIGYQLPESAAIEIEHLQAELAELKRDDAYVALKRTLDDLRAENAQMRAALQRLDLPLVHTAPTTYSEGSTLCPICQHWWYDGTPAHHWDLCAAEIARRALDPDAAVMSADAKRSDPQR